MPNAYLFAAIHFLKIKLPSFVLSQASQVPNLPDRFHETANKFIKATEKVQKLTANFDAFLNHTWYFENTGQALLLESMTPEDADTFSWDPTVISWRAFLENFCFGLIKYVLKQGAAQSPPFDVHEFGSTRFQRALL
jgi:hypothetical protein